ncbi:hypothetical protein QR680_018954 [Steinernema hermaphroditum]|uniref:Uncharacterized protein n=1 Tax=Steinernema hermaphroditum TaxID=289476 RepID=A0AA39HLP8_9BILA|nr:hypothetical protein QR680_018954 [Steinernema hermaphroditum]
MAPESHSNERLQAVLSHVKVVAYFVFFVIVALLKKLSEVTSEQLRKVSGGRPNSGGIQAKVKGDDQYEALDVLKNEDLNGKSEKSEVSNMTPLTPGNIAGIKDPRYQTLHGLSDDIFKRKTQQLSAAFRIRLSPPPLEKAPLSMRLICPKGFGFITCSDYYGINALMTYNSSLGLDSNTLEIRPYDFDQALSGCHSKYSYNSKSWYHSKSSNYDKNVSRS